jgi:hypothetical protein
VHLTHPLGVKAFEYRRVKNDVRDAADLAGLLARCLAADPATVRRQRQELGSGPLYST